MVLSLLEEKYEETPTWAGVNSNGQLVELTTNEETGTWSLLVTQPKKPTCLITNGDGSRIQDKNQEKLQLDPKA